MVISVLSIVVLVLITMLVLLFKFSLHIYKSNLALIKTCEDLGNMYNVYLIKTDIKVKANTFLNINILAEDLSDATSNASYLKYNGEELKKHIVSVEVLVQNVLRDTWNLKDLNLDYKEEGDENYED